MIEDAIIVFEEEKEHEFTFSKKPSSQENESIEEPIEAEDDKATTHFMQIVLDTDKVKGEETNPTEEQHTSDAASEKFERLANKYLTLQ